MKGFPRVREILLNVRAPRSLRKTIGLRFDSQFHALRLKREKLLCVTGVWLLAVERDAGPQIISS